MVFLSPGKYWNSAFNRPQLLSSKFFLFTVHYHLCVTFKIPYALKLKQHFWATDEVSSFSFLCSYMFNTNSVLFFVMCVHTYLSTQIIILVHGSVSSFWDLEFLISNSFLKICCNFWFHYFKFLLLLLVQFCTSGRVHIKRFHSIFLAKMELIMLNHCNKIFNEANRFWKESAL